MEFNEDCTPAGRHTGRRRVGKRLHMAPGKPSYRRSGPKVKPANIECNLPVLFQSDDDGYDGHGIHGKTRKEPTLIRIFSVSFRGFRGDKQECQHSAQFVSIRHYQVESVLAASGSQDECAAATDLARMDRHMTEFDIYLASASPRRQALLTQIDVRFQQVGVAVDESRQGGESPADYACRLALEKARAGMAKRPAGDTRPVLGADTIVMAGDAVLGKPRDRDHGLHMLALLSGRTHAVLSAVAVVAETEAVCCSESFVTFRELNDRERLAYWASGEPADKAGAYAIQGLAAAFIARLEGSYSGVMGLPLFETARLLSRVGIDVMAQRQPQGMERDE